MALASVQEQYKQRDNAFFKHYYHYFIFMLMIIIVVMLAIVGIVMYQMKTRPLPVFDAVTTDHHQMHLTPFEEPNLLSDTILSWASKAATTAFTFDFVNYNKEISQARLYFTDAGWGDFNSSISHLISTIVQNQLFVSGVVSGTPVISNQGPLPGQKYVWRVQIPFLVTYQSANTTSRRDYFVVLSITRVPTTVNPRGIGIDQFVMVPR